MNKIQLKSRIRLANQKLEALGLYPSLMKIGVDGATAQLLGTEECLKGEDRPTAAMRAEMRHMGNYLIDFEAGDDVDAAIDTLVMRTLWEWRHCKG